MRNLFLTQPKRPATLRITVALLAVASPFAFAHSAVAQTPLAIAPPPPFAVAGLSPNLPDSPGYLASSSRETADSLEDSNGESLNNEDSNNDQQTNPSPGSAKARTRQSAHLQMTIAPNEIAAPMPVRDKVVGGLKSSVGLFSMAGWVASAGWTQITNGSPNYGTDKGAFGQRLAASAVRNVSENIFTDCIFAPVFHEDPRYYVMGRGNNVFKRAIYAATRAVVTRTDSGHTTPNFALLAGNAAGSALTVTYYPAKNTTFTEVAQTFGGSLGGSALGFVVTEFIGDAMELVHLKKRD
ncbi:MAG: hypothetical protein ABI286_09085 [Edaphobacter sp.]